MRPQRLAVGQQKVERAMPGNLRHQLAQGAAEFVHAGHAGVRLGQLLHEPAKCPLAVGLPHRFEIAVQARRIVNQVAVVREHPVAPPQLTNKGVAVFQAHFALRGFADMGNHVLAFDRVAADQLGNRRAAGALVVHKVAHALPFKKGNAPAVPVMIGVAAALGKAAEAEGHIGGGVGVHTEQLAHGSILDGCGYRLGHFPGRKQSQRGHGGQKNKGLIEGAQIGACRMA